MKNNTILLLSILFYASSLVCMKRSDSNVEIDREWEMAKLSTVNGINSKKMKLTDFQEQALSAQSKTKLKKAYVNVLLSVTFEYALGNLDAFNVAFNQSALDNLCAEYLRCKEEERVHKERIICQLAHQHSIIWYQLRQMTGHPTFNLLSNEYHSLLDQLNALEPNWRDIVARADSDQREQLNVTQDQQIESTDDSTPSESFDI